jgi:peptide/nickel transport system ATP-binding protein
MMGTTAMLEVRDLSVVFQRIETWGRSRRIEALRGLSLELHPGEIVAVVGSSGAGKSVLAHAILGILPSNVEIEGEILYRGEVLTKRRLEQLRGREIALLPQSITFLDPLVKAKHAVRWAARMSGLGRAEARAAQRRAFLRLGLPEEIGDRFPSELSGGMVRRVLLAMATVGNASLLVADEPTPGLHPEAVQESLRRLRLVADQGSAVLLISHDIAACLAVADRVAVFLDGAVVEVARAAAFSGRGEQLRHRYSRALWNALPQNLFLETPSAGGLGGTRVSGA